MEDQSKSIMKDMEDTRSSMSAKLEALEDKVTGTVQPVADAVERVTEAAASAVERVTEAASHIADDVKETVHGVTQKVEDTAVAMAKAFSLRRQAERHPWVVFSVAATTGCVMGTLLGGRTRRKPSRSHGTQESRSRQSNGKSHSKESAAAKRSSSNGSSQENVFGETIQHLKGLAIGSLMSLLRDLAKRSVPGPIGAKIAEEVESLTTRMGAQPIAGPVLSEEPERRSAKQNYGETGSSEGQGTAALDVANRLRAGGTGPGLR